MADSLTESDELTLFRQIVDGTVSSIANSSVTKIGAYAFARCDQLVNADFPNAEKTDGGAFQYCGNLVTVSLPKMTSIGGNCFASCSMLQDVHIPSATYLDGSAFTSCPNLKNMSMPNVSYIGARCFNQCGFEAVNLPSVMSLGSSAFYGCSYLSSAELPTVSRINAAVFRNCVRLVSLNLVGVSSVPTLASTTAFSSTPIGGWSADAGQYGSVYVPASLYEAFCSATNWSIISSRIVSVAEGE